MLDRTLLNSTDARALLGGISETSLWRLVKSPGFPKPVKIARRRLFDRAELLAWVDAQRHGAASVAEAA